MIFDLEANNMVKKENFAYLNYLKAFAAITVVTHHSCTYSGLLSGSSALQALCHIIAITTLPLFFLISGYLSHEKKRFLPYFGKKLEKLLIPFFLFTFLKLGYTFFISNSHAHGTSIPSQLFDAFVCGNLYWFVYAILLYFLLSPLFWKLKKWNIALIAVIFIINIILDYKKIVLTDILQIGNAFMYIGYYILGYVLQLYQDKLTRFEEKFRLLLFFLSIAISTGTLALRLTVMDMTPYWMKIPAALSIIYLLYLPAKKLPNNIASLDFLGKHALHIMFFDSIFKVILFAIMQPNSITSLGLVIALNISLTCICCLIIKKIPVVRVLFGL